MTANPEITFFDPNSAENPENQHLMLMRPDTGEVVTPQRAQQERRIAEATARRTVTLGEWGPERTRDKRDIAVPDGLNYSA